VFPGRLGKQILKRNRFGANSLTAGLKRFSTLYALTHTTYAIGGATGPILVGRVFDTMGSYRPITIQLLALPALIPCLLMFALPRYDIQSGRSQTIATIPGPQPVETVQ
jgi:hypothetical protein